MTENIDDAWEDWLQQLIYVNYEPVYVTQLFSAKETKPALALKVPD